MERCSGAQGGALVVVEGNASALPLNSLGFLFSR